MRELSLIKILNGSIDALYYEMSYGRGHDIVPPIVNSSLLLSTNNDSTESSREKSRLNSSQVIETNTYDTISHNVGLSFLLLLKSKKISKLQYHKIRSSFYCEHFNWLLTADKEIAIWDVETETIKDM